MSTRDPRPYARPVLTTRLAAVAVGVLVATVLPGCGRSGLSPEAVEASARWDAGDLLDAYAFTLTSSCGERLLLGTYRVTVVHGDVTDVTGLDDVGVRIARMGQDLTRLVPTVGGLLDRIARDDADDVAEVTFDADSGVPTSVTFDPRRDTADDEECYTVADVRASP